MSLHRLSFLVVVATLLAAAPAPRPAPRSAPMPTRTPRLPAVSAGTPAAVPTRLTVPFDLFFHELRSYGAWVQTEDGKWAWRPTRVASDWRPFGQGTWAFTDVGWFWLSDEPWGWATSHYGRWALTKPKSGTSPTSPSIRNPEWFWFPAPDWSPAQVEWRQGDTGIGWCPIQGSQSSDSAIGSPQSAIESGWTFLPWSNASRAALPRPGTLTAFRQPNTLEALVISSTTAQTATPELLSQTHPISNPNQAGPDRSLVERKTSRRLSPCRILDSGQPRELLLVARDETAVVAFRPLLKESAEQIQQFLTSQAERYRALEKRKTKL